MRIRLVILALSLYALVADAHTFVPPEVVRLENVQIEGDIGTVYADNGNSIYALYCAAKVAGCRWKMPLATRSITLTSVQDMTVKRNESKNIGIVLRDAKGYFGLYLLDPARSEPSGVVLLEESAKEQRVQLPAPQQLTRPASPRLSTTHRQPRAYRAG
jgi:hypothetical protein